MTKLCTTELKFSAYWGANDDQSIAWLQISQICAMQDSCFPCSNAILPSRKSGTWTEKKITFDNKHVNFSGDTVQVMPQEQCSRSCVLHHHGHEICDNSIQLTVPLETHNLSACILHFFKFAYILQR